MFAWFGRLFAGLFSSSGRSSGSTRRARGARRAPSRRPAAQAGTQVPVSGTNIAPALPTGGRAPAGEPSEADPDAFPVQLGGVGNLDAVRAARAGLQDRERKLFVRIGERILARKFDLPQLPSTTMVVMEMASQPETDVEAIVEAISADPTLSGEFLRVANSALFAGAVPTETLHDAIVRLGRRTVRSVTLSISMRGMILKNRGILNYAEEVWRQARSVAVISRSLAKQVSMDPEHGYLLGLMHDVGKVSLLSDLSRELDKAGDLSSALVGGVFARFHEPAGEALARAWGLSDEVASVAGNHHKFERNEEHTQAAALVSLAHRMDLFLSMGAEREYYALHRSPEMDALAIDEARRSALLTETARTFGQDRAEERSPLAA